MTDANESRRVIREIIYDLAPEKVADTGADHELIGQLAYHSLALLEMAFALEDEFGLPPIDQESAQAIRTVGDVERYVLDASRDAGAGAEAGA